MFKLKRYRKNDKNNKNNKKPPLPLPYAFHKAIKDLEVALVIKDETSKFQENLKQATEKADVMIKSLSKEHIINNMKAVRNAVHALIHARYIMSLFEFNRAQKIQKPVKIKTAADKEIDSLLDEIDAKFDNPNIGSTIVHGKTTPRAVVTSVNRKKEIQLPPELPMKLSTARELKAAIARLAESAQHYRVYLQIVGAKNYSTRRIIAECLAKRDFYTYGELSDIASLVKDHQYQMLRDINAIRNIMASASATQRIGFAEHHPDEMLVLQEAKELMQAGSLEVAIRIGTKQHQDQFVREQALHANRSAMYTHHTQPQGAKEGLSKNGSKEGRNPNRNFN